MGTKPEKNKGGRPCSIKKEKIQELKQAFCLGCTDEEACLFAGVKRSTFYDFCKRYPEFSEQKELWKKNPVLKAKKLIFDNLGADLKTARWYLERKCKDEFSLKEEMSTGSNDDTKQAYLQALKSGLLAEAGTPRAATHSPHRAGAAEADGGHVGDRQKPFNAGMSSYELPLPQASNQDRRISDGDTRLD